MNLRVVRKKIKSVKNIKKITKAMQLVSAVKMRKAQQAEVESRPYREGLMNVIQKIVEKIDVSHSPLLNPPSKSESKNLIILVSSNKGLAGAFNVNLFRFMMKKDIDFSSTDFVTIGTKGAQFAARIGSHIQADFSSGHPITEVSAIFNYAVEQYLNGQYQAIYLIYNKFISAMRSEVMQEQLLPFTIQPIQQTTAQLKKEYLIEPSPREIIDSLLHSYIEDRVRGAVISSEAVEHSARMMAMKTATDNASDVIYNLTLVGNKLRQTKITNELLDMVTAKESVEQ